MNTTRRTFLRTAAAGAAVGLTAAAAESAEVVLPMEFIAPEKPYMDTYLEGILNITDGIRRESVPSIVAAMEKAWEAHRNGRKIYSHMLVGHFAMFAGSPDRPGQPNVLPQRVDRNTRADFEAMREGDFLLTNGTEAGVAEARKKGVYVVGVTNNYIRFSKTPPDFLRNAESPAIEDISDLVIDSHVPYDNGLILAPQDPYLKIIPSSGISQFLVYWACTASLATLIGSKGKDNGEAAVRTYLDTAYDRFRMIGTDRPKLDEIGAVWADLMLTRKARLFVYGAPQEVKPYLGCRNLFENEACFVASGTVMAQPYTINQDKLRAGDILLIGGLTSNHPLEIDAALHARRAGAYSTVFCPFATEGDSSGVRLFKYADAAFNTYSEERDGLLSVPGFERKICPLTGLAGNFVHWMLTAAWTDHMSRRGAFPMFRKGGHEAGSPEHKAVAEKIWMERGY